MCGERVGVRVVRGWDEGGESTIIAGKFVW